LMEINNGSVFCVCLMSDFVVQLNSFIDRCSPDLIILEASGLSDTTSIAEIVEHPLLSGKIYLAANWCVVDAVHFLTTGKMQQRIIHQIRMADMVLINKTDKAGDHVPEIVKSVKAINPFAEIVPTVYCKIPFTSEKLPVVRYFPVSTTALPKPDIHSMVIKTTRTIPEAKLQKFLELWSPLAYRIKGYVAVENSVTLAVQCLPGQIEVKPVDYWPGPTELIALTDKFTLHEWNRSFRKFVE